MKPRYFLPWTCLVLAIVALVCGPGAGRAFALSVPTCNSFDATGSPIYSASDPPDTTGTTNCTDYFGVNNWANSPLPSSPITGFTLVSGGSGYINPQVVITDPDGSGATATAATHEGAITGITLNNQGSGYIIPRVSIVDVGAGGTLGAPTCGGAAQPECGSGAMATAVLGGPYAGGMQKFLDPLADLKALIAAPDTATFPGSDYYEIALVEYSQKMHSSLPPTTLRGYVQVKSGSTNISSCTAAQWVKAPSYLGPVIVAVMDRPVRVKFTNCLPAGAGGNLFVPVDPTYMGAGMGPGGQTYTENRATLHLHGGATPWISDGTPLQWTAPVGESSTTLLKGDSVAYVPDMFFNASGAVVPPIPQCSKAVTTNCYPGNVPAGLSNNPGPGSLTFYWTNQQGGRLMFYHDHAYGITRLNVYAGEAAGYLIVDPLQEDILAAGTSPGTVGSNPDLAHLIPLVIQDKTFVAGASQMGAQDPTWAPNFGTTPGSANPGDLWMPHVYMPNQNSNDPTMASGVGHWDYGPWFFPPMTTLTAATPSTAVTVTCTSAAYPGQVLAPTSDCPTCGCPIIPNPSGTPESFMDTPVVNGVAYPVLHLAPEAYRFQILNAANDRSFNLSWFVADQSQNNTEVAMLPADPHSSNSPLPLCSTINPVAVPSLAIGLATGLLDGSGSPLNGTGLPANCWPNYGPQQGIPLIQSMWPGDGRSGGVPDPRTAGPAWIQIGSEGGLLPSPVVIPSTPTNYEFNTRSITIGSVGVHGLWIGGAERSDLIVDFSKFAGKTLILYNDAPAPAPATDSRLDYFTGDGDQTPIGGAPNTPPGYGPNTRTIMQVVIDQPATSSVKFSLPLLKQAFDSTATSDGLFALTQPTTIVPQAGYNSAYNQTFTDTFFGIQSENLTFIPFAAQNMDRPCAATPPAICGTLDRKTIQELFTADYGRMNATLGVELPLTNFLTQTTIPYGYVDPPTEIIREGDTQLWRITHNGVDTHFIHFHLFNVQVVNRVGWDGSLRPPDANELGWKDTVRMNPLEDILVVLQPITPLLPFPVRDSNRYMDVTQGPSTFTNVDPDNNPVTVTNMPINFGWEYVWHCHILGHEENDMMRPIVFQVAPPAPSDLLATGVTGTVTLTWTDNSASEDSYTVQRDIDPSFPAPTTITVDSGNSTGFSTLGYGQTITYIDSVGTGTYYYRVQANNSFTPTVTVYPVAFQPAAMSSTWSNSAFNGPIAYASVAPTALGFGSLPVGSTSTAQNITVTNTGTASMTGIATAVTGSTGFGVTNTCPGALVPGTSCSIAVTFTPAASGAAAATLTITSSASNNPAPSVQLSGTGIAPVATILATSLTFTNQPLNTLSTAQTFTMANTGNELMTGITFTTTGGNAPGDFLLAHDCGTSLAAGSFCTVTVTFRPTAVGSRTTSVSMTGSAANLPVSVSLSGTGITQATGSVSPASIAFGDQLLTTISSAQTVTVTNSGSASLVSTITVTGANTGDFVLQANGCASVAVGTSCAMTVTFAPTALGARTASISLATNDPVNPLLVVTMTGNGTAPVASVTPASITFGSQLLNTQSTSTVVTLTNSGNLPLANITTVVTGTAAADYVITSTTCNGILPSPVPPATTTNCMVNIAFRPTAGGTRVAAITIGSNDPVHPVLTVPLTGTGIAPIAGVAPASLAFGSQIIYTISSAQTVTLSNTGTADLSITSISTGAPYAQTNNCGSTLAPGLTCSINVTFGPVVTGLQAGVLNIVSNDPTNPTLTVALSGTGIVPIAEVTPSVDFGDVLSGTTSRAQTIMLSNAGTAALVISSMGLAGTNAAEFTVSGSTCGTLPATVAPGAHCTVNVTFTPSAGGMRTATFDVVSNDPAHPAVSTTLSGTGTSLAVSTAALDFGPQLVGTTSAGQAVSASNTSTTALKMTSIANGIVIGGANAADFTRSTSCTTTLGAGKSCTITVKFKPTAPGVRTATLTIANNDPASPRPVELTGTAVSPVNSLDQQSLGFSSPLKVASAAQVVTVTNTGTAPMKITGLALGGAYASQFARSTTCGTFPATLAPGASCTASMTFKPTAASPSTKNATLSVNVAKPAVSQKVTLTGTVEGEPVNNVSSTSLSFGAESVGTASAAQTVTVTNTGSDMMTLNGISIGGLGAGQFAQTNDCGPFPASMAAGASCTINVVFKPTAKGNKSATLSVKAAAPAGTGSVTLTGAGQ